MSEDKPVPADYDGDGKAEIAVFRQSNRFVYMIRSSTNTAEYFWQGYPGNVPQIGDYDGDFIMDIGGYDPTTMQWGAYTDFGGIFGAPGAIPTSSMIRIE